MASNAENVFIWWRHHDAVVSGGGLLVVNHCFCFYAIRLKSNTKHSAFQNHCSFVRNIQHLLRYLTLPVRVPNMGPHTVINLPAHIPSTDTSLPLSSWKLSPKIVVSMKLWDTHLVTSWWDAVLLATCVWNLVNSSHRGGNADNEQSIYCAEISTIGAL